MLREMQKLSQSNDWDPINLKFFEGENEANIQWYCISKQFYFL